MTGIDVWVIPQEVLVAAVAATDRSGEASVLSAQEWARHDRLVSPESRARFRASRVFLRRLLSAYAARAPDEWRFVVGAYGRPRILDAPERLDFNLSHDDGYLAIAVSRGHRCGIDIEQFVPSAGLLAAARLFLHPRESSDVERARPQDRPALVRRIWIAKEAYTKALGRGFSYDFRSFGLQLAQNSGPVTVSSAADGWRIWERTIDGHGVAMAVFHGVSTVSTYVLDHVPDHSSAWGQAGPRHIDSLPSLGEATDSGLPAG